jgi:membrane-bound lytic murein transglycosylase D
MLSNILILGFRMRGFLTLLFAFLSISSGVAAASPEFDLASVAGILPQKGLEPRIAFWKMIYTQYDRRHVVLHDRENLAIIYKVITFDRLPEVSELERREQKRKIEEEGDKIENALKDLANNGVEAAGFSSTHKGVYKALEKAGVRMDRNFLLEVATRVRDQRGIKDRFEAGIIRSGLYLPYIKESFSEKGLPEDLAYLPHVESSFDYASYSKVGAAGIWQFMRGTARGLLTINSLMDERRDPIRATEAAAALLSKNYRQLGSWPLAITAYNHGLNGMLRAKESMGGDYLSILDKYESKYWGFASKNFYSEFLAALDAAKNFHKYFPLAKPAEPLEFAKLVLKSGSRAAQLRAISRISEGTLRAYNPAISVDIKRSFNRLPSGYALRLPDGAADEVIATLSPEAQRWITRAAPVGSVKKAHRKAHHHRVRHKPRRYKVRRGDTLARIAQRFQVSSTELKQKNKSLKRSGRVLAGQVILLP